MACWRVSPRVSTWKHTGVFLPALYSFSQWMELPLLFPSKQSPDETFVRTIIGYVLVASSSTGLGEPPRALSWMCVFFFSAHFPFSLCLWPFQINVSACVISIKKKKNPNIVSLNCPSSIQKTQIRSLKSFNSLEPAIHSILAHAAPSKQSSRCVFGGRRQNRLFDLLRAGQPNTTLTNAPFVGFFLFF